VYAAARAAAYAVRRMPGGVPDGLRYRFGRWFDASPAACQTACVYRFGGWFSFETGPAACLTARSYRFGSRRARWLARIASVDGSDRDWPGILPDGSLAALRRMVRRKPGGLPGGLRISLQPMVRIETGPAACPTAHSYRCGLRRARRLARRLARIASADGSDRDGPGGWPDRSLVSLRRMVLIV